MADDGDGMRLATSQGERRGRDVLIATGAWSPLLAKTTGLSKLPIQPGKGYSITYDRPALAPKRPLRSEEHTSELQSLMRISYAVFCLKKKKNNTRDNTDKYIATITIN